MNLFCNGLTVREFFADHWRRRPLHVPGGAETFLGRQWTEADFEAALQAATGPETGATVRVDDHDTVSMIEHVSTVDADLGRRMHELAGPFGTGQPWCNAVRTYQRPSGIGSHYDHSDNFVLQMAGTKHWKLAAPSHIPSTDYARRMMLHPDVGHRELPDGDTIEVVLEPGDLLYLPLMWLHSGVSTGPSLSLSVLCPAPPVSWSFLPALAAVIHQQAVGFPAAEVLPDWLSAEERQATLERHRASLLAVFEQLDDRELRRLVIEQAIGTLVSRKPSDQS